MERKKLVYNAIGDLWKIASQEYANKSITDMNDEDWENLIRAIDDSSKKYGKLRPEESKFYSALCQAFMDLIEREVKTEIEVPSTSTPSTVNVWVDSETALKRYGISIPKRKPNK